MQEAAANEKNMANSAIKSGIFMLTNSCNLRCDYCFEYEHAAKHMSKETAHQGIRWLLDNGDKRVSIILFGGEPLVRKDIIPWFLETARKEAKARDKQVGFSITSNGTLLDREIGEVLKREKVHFRLSADGIAEAQNVHRRQANKKDSYELVEKAIPLIMELFPSRSVRMTITPKNVQWMTEGVEHFVNLGFDSVHPVPNVEGGWTPDTMKIYAQHMERIGAFFMHNLLNERYLNIYGITDMIQRAVSPAKTYLCGAGRAMAAIDTDGALFPCQRFLGYHTSGPRWKMGNLWDGFDKEKRDYFFDTLTIQNVQSCKPGKSESGLCQGCEIFQVCSGGCPAVNELQTGDPLKASPGYIAFKTICIDEVHGIVTFMQSKYPEVWEKYLTRLSGSHGKKAKNKDNKKENKP
jgi:uncharacterized protein